MSLVKLFGKNILDQSGVTVTSSSALSTKPITRVYDRDRGPQWEAAAAGSTTITVDQASLALPLTDYFIGNHNLGVNSILLDSSPDNAVWTNRATFNGTSGTDIWSTISTQSIRYWRLTMPVFASAPAIGEYFLGAAIEISKEPAYGAVTDGVEGNVSRRRAVGGYVRKARLGEETLSFRWSWNLLPEADWDNLVTFFGDIGESAKHFPLMDVDGSIRWVELLTPRLVGQRVFQVSSGSFLRSVSLEFQEAL